MSDDNMIEVVIRIPVDDWQGDIREALMRDDCHHVLTALLRDDPEYPILWGQIDRWNYADDGRAKIWDPDWSEGK